MCVNDRNVINEVGVKLSEFNVQALYDTVQAAIFSDGKAPLKARPTRPPFLHRERPLV